MAKRKPTKPLHPAVAIARGRRILAERAAGQAKPAPGERLRQQQALFGKTPPSAGRGEGDIAETTRFEPAPTLIASKSAKHPGCWTPEITALAAEMWTVQRASLSEIAKALSERVGWPVSRNSVIEKLKRLGLAGKGGRQSEAGKPVTERDQRVEVVAKGVSPTLRTPSADLPKPPRNLHGAMHRPVRSSEGEGRRGQSASPLTQHGAATPGSPPRDGKAPAGYVAKSQLGPTGHRVEHPSDVPTDPTIISAPTIEAAKINTPPETDLSALFDVRLTERPSHPAGQWPITDLRMGQCKFACNDPPRGGLHLFCGEPADPEDRHGSWCTAHRSVVFSTESRLADRRFLKAAGRVR